MNLFKERFVQFSGSKECVSSQIETFIKTDDRISILYRMVVSDGSWLFARKERVAYNYSNVKAVPQAKEIDREKFPGAIEYLGKRLVRTSGGTRLIKEDRF
jgi:hypothetical protein